MLWIAVRLTEGCVISFCVFLPPGARFGPGSENHSRDQFGGFAYILPSKSKAGFWVRRGATGTLQILVAKGCSDLKCQVLMFRSRFAAVGLTGEHPSSVFYSLWILFGLALAKGSFGHDNTHKRKCFSSDVPMSLSWLGSPKRCPH